MEANSKTFCINPWIHLMVSTAGGFEHCCVSTRHCLKGESGETLNASNSNLVDSFNSPDMVTMRKQMVSGEQVSGCELCALQEKIGKKSYRQMNNEEWRGKLGDQFDRLVEASTKNDFIVESSIVSLDLRSGNKCNLACRMCNPGNSNVVARNWQEIDQKSDGGFYPFLAPHGLSDASIGNWYDADSFWEQIDTVLPGLKKLYLAGGEPTLVSKNFDLLEKCVALGVAKNIELSLNINMTSAPKRLLEVISHFKWVTINISIDGVGGVGEYIRYNSKWDVVEKNFESLLKLDYDNLSLIVTPVVQIYNIIYFDKLLSYIDSMQRRYKRNIGIDFLFCNHPRFLDIKFFPRRVKKLALRRLRWLKFRMNFYYPKFENRWIKESLIPLLDYLQHELGNSDEAVIEEFIQYTQYLDSTRITTIDSALPELCSALLSDGVIVSGE